MGLNIINIDDQDDDLVPDYASHALKDNVPKYKIPAKSMSPRAAYDLVHDMLMLDGNSRLNCATFVTTWMESEAQQLMTETFDKNMIDKDEYPQTAKIEARCIRILANLWHANSQNVIGCSTTGSSEAAMLAALAMKWRWREARKKAGKSYDKPNLVLGINAHVCWAKFCRYWDVEMRAVPMEHGRYILDPQMAVELCDENTIGVIGILGSTYNGQYEDIAAICKKLDAVEKEKGFDIPVHVDAASGGFVAPFIQKNLKWDFRLDRVVSINASGHKYGLVYPGVGWIVWRDRKYLSDDLIFNVDYLGDQMPTFALNFSRPGNQVVAQYYNFLRLGFEGYARVQKTSSDVAQYFATAIADMKEFNLIGDGTDLPVVCWTFSGEYDFTLFDLSDRLRMRGWQVPAYALPDNLSDVTVARIVVREGFSRDLASALIEDIKSSMRVLLGGKNSQSQEAFHH